MDIIDVSDFCKTKAQAVDFSTRLAAIEQQVYSTNLNLEKVLLEQFGLQKKDAFIALIRNNNIRIDGPATCKEFLANLQAMVAALPMVSLELAFEPQEQTLKVLSDWFLMNIKRQVLFELKVNPSLVGGVTINYNGKHADLSIKPQFEQILKHSLMNFSQPPQAPPHPVKPILKHQSIEHITFGR